MSENTWKGDTLLRKPYSKFLSKFLRSKKGPFVVNLNASWGSGKTFFLQNWSSDVSKDNYSIYINAWENDYSNDPLVTVMAEFNIQLNEQVERNNKIKNSLKEMTKRGAGLARQVGPEILKGIAARYIGQEAFDLINMSKDDEKSLVSLIGKMSTVALKEHESRKASIKSFKDSAEEFIASASENKGKNAPIFVFIDELDRCRPSYAIELLENIKHVFDIEGVVFVIATDSAQLSHSINSIYGENFDSISYLRRFFDRECRLPRPSNEDFLRSYFSTERYSEKIEHYNFSPNKTHTRCSVESVFISMTHLFSNVTLRDMEQCFYAFDSLIDTKEEKEIIISPLLIFLVFLFHFKRKEFSDMDRDGKVDFTELNKITNNPANIWIHNSAFDLSKVLTFLVGFLFISEGGMVKILNNRNNDLVNYFASDISRNFKYISTYIERVKMAGAIR